MPNSSSRLPPIPEPQNYGRRRSDRIRAGRRVLLAALILSLVVHLAGGLIFSVLHHVLPQSQETEDKLIAQKITISTPRPTPKPTQQPTPKPTPTPAPTPTPKPIFAQTKNANPRPHPPRPVVVVKSPPPPEAAPPRPHELSSNKKIHSQPRAQKKTSIQDKIAQAIADSSATIASAQHDVGQTAAPTTGYYGDGHTDSMKHYSGIGDGLAGFSIGGNGTCQFRDRVDRGDLTYVYLVGCRVHYSDGRTEIVDIPWRYHFPKGHVPAPGAQFEEQAPPEDFVLPENFELSRAVCTYYRTRCDAIEAHEKALGLPQYGQAP